MGADGKPEISGPPKSGRCKQGEDPGGNDANTCLTAVAHVDPGKQNGLNDGRRPEADAVRESVKKIPTEGILLKKSYQQKEKEPENTPTEDLSVYGDDVPHVTDVQNTKNY